jgi:hypothetical protein
MSLHPKNLIRLSVAILLLIVIAVPLTVKAQSDAATAIASAKGQLVTCYQSAKDAENAGANITELTVTLNDAGTLLSQAQFEYSLNKISNARDLALQSQAKLEGFTSKVNSLKENAILQKNQDFTINMVGSIAGAFAVLGGGAAVWFFLKKKLGMSGAITSGS